MAMGMDDMARQIVQIEATLGERMRFAEPEVRTFRMELAE